MSYIVKTKSVNSKLLCQQIREFIDSAIEDFGVLWASESQRESLVEIIDEFFADLHLGQQNVEQWDVICDHRNNNQENMQKGMYTLMIKYRQKHCFNITEITYNVSTKGVPTDIDFDYIV